MGRSIHFNWKSKEWILRIANEHDSSSLWPYNEQSPSLIDCNEGRSIHFISFQINIILSIIVVLEPPNDRLPNSIDCNEGRSIALFIYIQNIML